MKDVGYGLVVIFGLLAMVSVFLLPLILAETSGDVRWYLGYIVIVILIVAKAIGEASR